MSIDQINQAIQQAGLQEQSAAANAAMIINSLDRELKKSSLHISLDNTKINPKELKESIEMVAEACQVKRVRKHEQKKEKGEDKEKRKNKKSQPIKGPQTKSKERPFPWKGRKKLTTKKTMLKAGEIDKFKKNEGINLELLKEYSVLYSKKILEIPPVKENNLMLEESERKLDLPFEILSQFQARLKKLIFEELAYILKDHLLGKLKSPKNILDFVLKTKKSSDILNFTFFNEILSLPTEKENLNLIQRNLMLTLKEDTHFGTSDIKELMEIAKEAGVDFIEWSPLRKIEQMKADKHGELIIDTSLLEKERIKSFFLDELRLLEVKRLLEKGLRKKILILFRKIKVLNTLKQMGASKEEIEKVKDEARKIAWAKSIAILKDLHLKRIFTASMRNFSKYSSSIRYYTIKSRKLGSNININKKGLQWIETRLETLALESAEYKLELLKSMQTLDYTKQREKDIKQLNVTVEHYRAKIKLRKKK